MSDLPRVLVLGGCGFVGRNLVEYLIQNNLISKVRVADKVPPQTAWLNERHQKIFADERVEFKQANLLNTGHVDRAFESEEGSYDYVINCAAETRYGQTDEVYREYVYELSLNCAKKSAATNVKRYIELSTAQVYSSDKKASDESSKTSPWTLIAKWKLKVEDGLSKIEGLNYVIVRPAIIYGIGDKLGLTPRLIIGAVYKQLGEKMELLWTSGLKMNTVHVYDAVRALWFLCENGESGQIYNLSDKNESSLIFDMKQQREKARHWLERYHFVLNMSGVVEDSNDKHLAPWSEACHRDKIENTPLSPYLDQELLYNTHLHVDGTKIEKLGFTYERPNIKVEYLREMVDDFVALGVFPPSLAH